MLATQPPSPAFRPRHGKTQPCVRQPSPHPTLGAVGLSSNPGFSACLVCTPRTVVPLGFELAANSASSTPPHAWPSPSPQPPRIPTSHHPSPPSSMDERPSSRSGTKRERPVSNATSTVGCLIPRHATCGTVTGPLILPHFYPTFVHIMDSSAGRIVFSTVPESTVYFPFTSKSPVVLNLSNNVAALGGNKPTR